MMNFRTVTAQISKLLADAADGNYRVVGMQEQGKDAETVRGLNRLVQVYYSHGTFPKKASRFHGTAQHDMTFSIALTVSAPCQVDLATVNNPSATTLQKTTAMSAMLEASALADTYWDELAEYVYQVMKSGLNIYLGLDAGVIANPWIDSMRKDSPTRDGALVVLTGVVEYSCRTTEDVLGDVGVEPSDINTSLMPGAEIDIILT